MGSTDEDRLGRAAFATARGLEPTEAEVAAVLARADRRVPVAGRRGSALRRLAVAGFATLVVGAAGYAAAPPLRAGIDDVTGTFSNWVSGDGPGRPVTIADDAPAYLDSPKLGSEPRVIAEAGGYRLYAYREPDGALGFDLGNTGVGLGFDPGSLSGSALYVLGPAAIEHADGKGHVPLFGLSARSVEAVELRYESGPPLRVDGIEGGFVLLAEPERGPLEVVAFDAEGSEVASQPVDDGEHEGPQIDWSQFTTPR